jgi:hypothetical protein
LTDSRNWHTATNSLEWQREAYSHYRHNTGKPIFAVSWLAYRYQLFAVDELDKPHILALAAETSFLLFKEQVSLKFKKINQRSMRTEDLSIDITFNPC